MTNADPAVKIGQERYTEIKNIVCEILEIEPSQMTGDSRFKEDHGADSLGAIEILSALERTFGVEIDQSELTRMVTLNSVVAVVDEASAVR